MASGRGGNGGNSGSGGSGNGGNNGSTSRITVDRFDEVVEGGYSSGHPDFGQIESTQGHYQHIETSDNGTLSVEGYSAGPANVEVRTAAYAEDSTAYIGGTIDGSAGPVSMSRSFYARADAHANDRGIHVGADAEYREEINAGPVSLTGTARAGTGLSANSGRTQVGADASADANVTVGGGGNEISAGVGVGAGVGIDVVHGEDSDGDGRGEIGFSLDFKAGVGGNVGFRFEPETVAEEVRSWFGRNEPAKVSREASYPFSCCDRFEAALEMPDTQAATARLQSLL